MPTSKEQPVTCGNVGGGLLVHGKEWFQTRLHALSARRREKPDLMTDSASVPTDEVQEALRRTRTLVADCDPSHLGDVAMLDIAIGQRNALKKAGDGMVYEISHPTKKGATRLMEAVVAYRRISDEVER